MRRMTFAAGALTLSTALAAQETTAFTADLKFKAVQEWNLILPRETWSPADSIAIPHQGGSGFVTEKNGLTLAIDTNGDGVVDRKVKGASGFAALNGKTPNGEPLGYAIRVKLVGNVYQYATSGVMAGSVCGVPIALIDQNNNGIYNEVGVDSLVVGGGRAASDLSKVVNLKGELYWLEANASGTSVSARPYDGPSGTLRVRQGLRLQGDLLAAVVGDPQSGVSFEVSSVDSLRVPTGNYVFTGGFAKKGSDTAMLRTGKMRPLAVEADRATTLAWGTPLVAEFDYTRSGNEVTVQPKVQFLGIAGEEWHTLLPDAKSPKLEFYDAASGKLLESKRFEGC